MNVHVGGLSKSYGALKVFEDVTFTVRPGDVVAVVGANGAGKTTLVCCLAGVLSPDSGWIRYDGELFSRPKLHLRRRIFSCLKSRSFPPP